MKALVRITATIEAEEWMDMEDGIDAGEAMKVVEQFGNEVIEAYYTAGFGDFNYEIVEVAYDDVDAVEDDFEKDYSSFAYDPEDEDEGDYDDYEPTDPDSVGTRIN